MVTLSGPVRPTITIAQQAFTHCELREAAVAAALAGEPVEQRIAVDGAALLKQGEFHRLAIANPALAPYGRAARETLEALGAWQAAEPRLVTAENVAQAYFNLLRYQRLLQVAIETRDQVAKELERTETYFRLGSVAKSDVLQAKVRLQQTRLDVLRASNASEQSFADLAHAIERATLGDGVDVGAGAQAAASPARHSTTSAVAGAESVHPVSRLIMPRPRCVRGRGSLRPRPRSHAEDLVPAVDPVGAVRCDVGRVERERRNHFRRAARARGAAPHRRVPGQSTRDGAVTCPCSAAGQWEVSRRSGRYCRGNREEPATTDWKVIFHFSNYLFI